MKCFSMRYSFEFLVDYTLTEFTVGLLAWGVLVIGFEIRHDIYDDYGACFGVIFANRWIGWTKGR